MDLLTDDELLELCCHAIREISAATESVEWQAYHLRRRLLDAYERAGYVVNDGAYTMCMGCSTL